MKVEDGLTLNSFESNLIIKKKSFCSKLCTFLKLMMIGSIVAIVFTLLLVFLTNKGANCLPRFNAIVQRKYIDACLNNGLYGSQRSCNEYYRCENSIPIPEQCEFGFEWSTLNNSCVSRQYSDCSKIFYCPNAFGRFRNELHCDTFYACYFNQPYLIYCPPPLLYSSRTKDCEWSEDSDCPSPKPTTTTTTTTTMKTMTTMTTTTTAATTTLDSTSEPNTTTISTTEKSFVYNCPNPDGFFSDPEDCHAYYFCSNNTGTKMYCSNGKGFNSKYLSCNEPKDSDCAQSNQLVK